MFKSCVSEANEFQFTTQRVRKRAYTWGERPCIEGTHDKSPVREGQVLHHQANVNTLLRRKFLVREPIEKHFGPSGE